MIIYTVPLIQELKPKWYHRVLNILIPLLVYGYPLQASITVLLNKSSTPINLAFRAAYAVISLLLVVIGLLKHKFNWKISIGGWLILFFWCLYLIRLIYDINFRGIVFGGGDALQVFGYAIGNCLLPSLAIIINIKYVEIKKIGTNLYRVLILTNLTIIGLIYYQNNGISPEIFLKRVSITDSTGELLIINTILIGFYGEVLIATSLFYLIFLKQSFYSNIFNLIFFLLGFFNIVVAGSRGPFLSLFILLCFIIGLKTYFSKNPVLLIAKTVIAGFLGLNLLFLTVITFLGSYSIEDLTLFSRLNSFKEQREDNIEEERDFEWRSAINQFKDNPIIGDQFVTTFDGYYPHNIHLEVFMALGIIGGIIYIGFYYALFQKFKLFLKHSLIPNLLICLFFIASTLSATLSGSLFQGFEFWILITLLLNVQNSSIDIHYFTKNINQILE